MAEMTSRRLIHWLLLVAAMVFGIVVIGGITRLTESGLSITEWKPVTGWIPPLSEADWAAAFEKYKHSSQYVLMNQGMDLPAFKTIFFWEWFHRFFARGIGLALLLPMVWFAWKRAIPSGFGVRMVMLAALLLLQGTVGWLMVKSGLTDRVTVEPLLLSAHLLTALAFLAMLVWTVRDWQTGSRRRPSLFGWGVIAIVGVQIFFGAMTAGLRAGQVSNTWPLMNDHFFPEGVDWRGGLGAALSHDAFLVHFIHRWWAWVAVVALIILARKARAAGDRRASIAIHSAFGAQILLGIVTVLMGVPLWLAVLHQAVGALVAASTIWGVHSISGSTGADAYPWPEHPKAAASIAEAAPRNL